MACLRAAVGMEPVSSVTCTESGPRTAQQAVAGQRPQRPADGFEVLGRQDLGGRQQRGLSPGVNHLEHGAQGNDGLAGAHLTLEEPVHGAVLRQFLCKGFSDGGLAGGEGKGQLAVERGQDAVGYRPAGGGFLGRQLGTAPRQGGLQDQGLLVPEAVPGPLPVPGHFRDVDQPVGLSRWQELLPR